jgi:hypothetical protein
VRCRSILSHTSGSSLRFCLRRISKTETAINVVWRQNGAQSTT